MKFHHFFPLVIIFLSLMIGIVLYPYLPDVVATHWGINGEVNGYSSKAIALFLVPGISVFLYIVLSLLPKIDPYKKSFTEFDSYYYLFVSLIFAFLFYTHLLTIFWQLGARFNMIQAMSPAFAILYYYAGVLCKNTRRNWFVGVRSPWTMSSEKVWEKTHEAATSLFYICGLFAFIGLFLPQFSLWLLIAPIISTSLILFFYSYYLYQRL